MAEHTNTQDNLSEQQLEARVNAIMEEGSSQPARAKTSHKTTVHTPHLSAASVATATELDEPVDDAQITAAIDDIVAQEADEVLAAEDAGLAVAAETSPALIAEPAVTTRHHPLFWFIILLIVVLAVASAVVLTRPDA